MSVTGKVAKNGTVESEPDDYMRKRPNKTNWQTLKDGLYNPTKGKVLGKTGKQWGITGLFYVCFFTGLSIFCAICYKGLLATLSDSEPRWKLDSSLIGTSPGMGFRPLPEDIMAGPKIFYNAANSSQVTMWIQRINKFLDNYMHSSQSETAGTNRKFCSHDDPNEPKKVCAVDLDNWGPCSSANGFGFNNSSPCVFIKLNKIYGWIPEYYNDASQLSSHMPESLVNHIKTIKGKELNTVWVSCNGTRAEDKKNVGDIEYWPRGPQGFPGYFYPYMNTPGYLSPLIAVYFTRPKVDTVISVECRAWAKNINHDEREKLGMVIFELKIDGPKRN